jgi:hypothetical protein
VNCVLLGGQDLLAKQAGCPLTGFTVKFYNSKVSGRFPGMAVSAAKSPRFAPSLLSAPQKQNSPLPPISFHGILLPRKAAQSPWVKPSRSYLRKSIMQESSFSIFILSSPFCRLFD